MKRVFSIILGILLSIYLLSSTSLIVYIFFKATDSQQNATAEPTSTICVPTSTPTQLQLLERIWQGKITIPPEAIKDSMSAIIDDLNEDVFSYIPLRTYEYNVICDLRGHFIMLSMDDSFDTFTDNLEHDITEGVAAYLSQTNGHSSITRIPLDDVANHVVWFDHIEMYYSLNDNIIDFTEFDSIGLENLIIQELTESTLVFTSRNGCTVTLSRLY